MIPVILFVGDRPVGEVEVRVIGPTVVVDALDETLVAGDTLSLGNIGVVIGLRDGLIPLTVKYVPLGYELITRRVNEPSSLLRYV